MLLFLSSCYKNILFFWGKIINKPMVVNLVVLDGGTIHLLVYLLKKGNCIPFFIVGLEDLEGTIKKLHPLWVELFFSSFF